MTKMVKVIGPGDLDSAPLTEFLDDMGMEAWRRDPIVLAVRVAIMRYLQTADESRRKDQLEKLLAAFAALRKALPALGSEPWLMLTISIGNTASGGRRELPEPLRVLGQLPNDLDILTRSAKQALADLQRNGRSPDARPAFVKDLAAIWKENNLPVGISGETTWEKPRGQFSRFVKICASQTGAPEDFEPGFGELIRRALRCRNDKK